MEVESPHAPAASVLQATDLPDSRVLLRRGHWPWEDRGSDQASRGGWACESGLCLCGWAWALEGVPHLTAGSDCPTACSPGPGLRGWWV